MGVRYYKCERNHYIALELDDRAFAVQNKKFQRGHSVCPHCREEHGNQPMAPSDPPEQYAFCTEKQYRCRHGHITSLTLFKNGYVHVKWGPEQGQFENIEGRDHVLEMIANGELKCRTVVMSGGKKPKPRMCNCQLKALDDFELREPSTLLFKTRVRVGDVWDKAKCPEPRHSKVNKKTGELKQTEFGKINTHRMQQDYMYEFDDETGKQKKFKRTRENEEAGEVLKKSTTTSYRSRKDRKPTEAEKAENNLNTSVARVKVKPRKRKK